MFSATRSLARAAYRRPAHPPEHLGVLSNGATRFTLVPFKQLAVKRTAHSPQPAANPPVRYGASLTLVLVALLMVVTSVLPAHTAAAAETPVLNVNDLEAELTSREAQLVAAVNVERVKEGLLPLRWNRNLSEAARSVRA